MPVNEKLASKQVTFALAILKADVIADPAVSDRIKAAVHLLFPGVSVILVTEDDALAICRRGRMLSEFAHSAPCPVIVSSKVSAN